MRAGAGAAATQVAHTEWARRRQAFADLFFTKGNPGGKFSRQGRRLLLLSRSAPILETLRTFGSEACPAENLFQDWDTLETALKAHGVNLTGEAFRPPRTAA